LEAARLEAKERLSPHGAKVVWVYKKSAEGKSEIPDELDFVYIDGNHQEEFVSEDIVNYFPKVRSGGVIGGHDFYNGFCREHDGVVSAVSRYAVENRLSLQVELPDWWMRK
jgi:hypothetical protein